jgi:hypothetical protein
VEILEDAEEQEDAVIKKSLITATDGKTEEQIMDDPHVAFRPWAVG